MSYSDEPNVIKERKRSKKVYLLIGGLVVFMAMLASVAFFPRIMDFRRQHAAVGPHEGTVYSISFEGERYSMELARSETFDFQLCLFIKPIDEDTEWRPEEYHALMSLNEVEEVERLDWNPEQGYFGPSEIRFPPRADFRVKIELQRDDTTVWSGWRWTFRPGGGHGHAH